VKPERYDAIVLGAGGAGMMCAAVAGRRGRRILLIDHAEAPGKKILISGGGRCNFTNLHAAPDRFLSANPRFAVSALARYTPADFLALVEAHGIAWHEKTLGQLFCDGSARQIVAMLLDECARGGVELALGHPVRDVAHADARFRLAFGVRTAEAPAFVIATGGPSIPKLGATGFAYDLARRFGLKVIEPRPGLVPLTLSRDEALFHALSGVSTEVVATAGKASFREAALFTHRGLSGPVILQISSYWRPGEPIHVDFLPDAQPGWLREAKRATPRATLKAALARRLPERLAEALAHRLAAQPSDSHSGQSDSHSSGKSDSHLTVGDSHPAATGLANLPDRRLEQAERRLAQWLFTPNGSEGFAKAEVTVGGIATAGLSSKTMAAVKVPGLYAIGEAVDVTGWLGGYNFQWAWASGVAAGEAV
jgi:predicted Rossmann fold flavoprotein